MLSWFDKPGYPQGVFFSLMFLFLGPVLDALMKLLGNRLPPMEIIFFRFLFSLLSMCIYMLMFNIKPKKTKYLKLNLIRGTLGYISFVGCVYSVTLLPLAEVTIIFWTMPFFSLILSAMILGERVSKNRWIATICGFSGLYFFLCPSGISIKLVVLIPIASAFFFALQDVIIKRIVNNDDSMLSMIFYFALTTTILSFPTALLSWETPTCRELLYLSALGIGANVMQYFIFKAFSAADVSSLAPFRYVEVVFAAIFGYAFFGDIPSVDECLGASVIIPTTLYLVYSEVSKRKAKCVNNVA